MPFSFGSSSSSSIESISSVPCSSEDELVLPSSVPLQQVEERSTSSDASQCNASDYNVTFSKLGEGPFLDRNFFKPEKLVIPLEDDKTEDSNNGGVVDCNNEKLDSQYLLNLDSKESTSYSSSAYNEEFDNRNVSAYKMDCQLSSNYAKVNDGHNILSPTMAQVNMYNVSKNKPKELNSQSVQNRNVLKTYVLPTRDHRKTHKKCSGYDNKRIGRPTTSFTEKISTYNLLDSKSDTQVSDNSVEVNDVQAHSIKQISAHTHKVPLKNKAKESSIHDIPLKSKAKESSVHHVPLKSKAKKSRFHNVPLKSKAKESSALDFPLKSKAKESIAHTVLSRSSKMKESSPRNLVNRISNTFRFIFPQSSPSIRDTEKIDSHEQSDHKTEQRTSNNEAGTSHCFPHHNIKKVDTHDPKNNLLDTVVQDLNHSSVEITNYECAGHDMKTSSQSDSYAEKNDSQNLSRFIDLLTSIGDHSKIGDSHDNISEHKIQNTSIHDVPKSIANESSAQSFRNHKISNSFRYIFPKPNDGEILSYDWLNVDNKKTDNPLVHDTEKISRHTVSDHKLDHQTSNDQYSNTDSISRNNVQNVNTHESKNNPFESDVPSLHHNSGEIALYNRFDYNMQTSSKSVFNVEKSDSRNLSCCYINRQTPGCDHSKVDDSSHITANKILKTSTNDALKHIAKESSIHNVLLHNDSKSTHFISPKSHKSLTHDNIKTNDRSMHDTGKIGSHKLLSFKTGDLIPTCKASDNHSATPFPNIKNVMAHKSLETNIRSHLKRNSGKITSYKCLDYDTKASAHSLSTPDKNDNQNISSYPIDCRISADHCNKVVDGHGIPDHEIKETNIRCSPKSNSKQSSILNFLNFNIASSPQRNFRNSNREETASYEVSDDDNEKVDFSARDITKIVHDKETDSPSHYKVHDDCHVIWKTNSGNVSQCIVHKPIICNFRKSNHQESNSYDIPNCKREEIVNKESSDCDSRQTDSHRLLNPKSKDITSQCSSILSTMNTDIQSQFSSNTGEINSSAVSVENNLECAAINLLFLKTKKFDICGNSDHNRSKTSRVSLSSSASREANACSHSGVNCENFERDRVPERNAEKSVGHGIVEFLSGNSDGHGFPIQIKQELIDDYNITEEHCSEYLLNSGIKKSDDDNNTGHVKPGCAVLSNDNVKEMDKSNSSEVVAEKTGNNFTGHIVSIKTEYDSGQENERDNSCNYTDFSMETTETHNITDHSTEAAINDNGLANEMEISLDKSKVRKRKKQGFDNYQKRRPTKRIKKEVDTEHDLDFCNINGSVGELVFARLKPASLHWPAMIVDHTKIGYKRPKNGSFWIFWFGDHKISQVHGSQLCSFANFSFLYKENKSKSKLYDSAISESLLIAASRGKRTYVKQDIKFLISWAISGFLKCSTLVPDPVTPVPDSVMVHLTSIKKCGKPARIEKQDVDTCDKEQSCEPKQRSRARTKTASQRRRRSVQSNLAITQNQGLPIDTNVLPDFKAGDVVWAKMEPYSWWPAIVFNGKDGGKKTAKSGFAWVFWFGDHKVSEVCKNNMRPYVEDFSLFYNKCNLKTFKKAVNECLQVVADRKEFMTREHDDADTLLCWAIKGFLMNSTKDASSDSSSQIPKTVMKYLKSIVERYGCDTDSDVVDSDESDSEVILPVPKQINSKSGAHERVQLKELRLEDVCIACNSADVPIKTQHPLFRGGVCESCCKDLLKALFAYGNDGKTISCVLCGQMGQLYVCDNTTCNRCYCVTCIKLWAAPNASKKIKEKEPWSCFFCDVFKPDINGLIQPNSDWEERLRAFYYTEIEVPKIDIAKRPMRVLSLFDGIGTAKYILDKLGIDVDVYWASEIDEHSVYTAAGHHPTVIAIGDIRKVTEDWIRDIACPVDLVIGGSPCNDLSQVNPDRKGLFDPSGTGVLFFQYVRILKAVERFNKGRHVFWLYENVSWMSQESKDAISKTLESEPLKLDATFFSPQNRKRLYWGNLPGLHDVQEYWNYERNLRKIQTHYKGEGILLDDWLPKVGNMASMALVPKINTVTTQPNSLIQKSSCPMPVRRWNGKYDTLWITDLEIIFGFPRNYTDVCNLTPLRRLQLLGRSWSVPVVEYLLFPLTFFFKTKQDQQV